MTEFKNKAGRLTGKDKEFIEDYADKYSIEELARQVRKNTNIVQKYIDDNDIPTDRDDKITRRIKENLKKSMLWMEIKKQFSKDEQKYFESWWIKLFLQFNEDVESSEELQIKKFISLEILKDRELKKQVGNQKEIERMQTILNAEYAKTSEQKHPQTIKSLTEAINNLKGSQSIYVKEFRELSKQGDAAEAALKISRGQRIQNIANSTKNWSNILKILENPVVRSNVNSTIEVMRKAKEAEFDRLSDWHKYSDGTVGLPITTHKTVKGIDS